MRASLNEMSNPARDKFDSLRRALRLGLASAAGLLQKALPARCALCNERSGTALLCDPCMNGLPPMPACCPACALPIRDDLMCSGCRQYPPPLQRVVAAHAYAFPVDRLIGALKYGGQLALAAPLGDTLAAAVQRHAATRPEILLPIPLAAARQRRRGFNQAIEIARVVSRQTGVPMGRGLVRCVDTAPQAGSTAAQRRHALRGAFGVTMPFRYRHVALVDDVMTTGSTLAEAAHCLIAAGVGRVDAYVVGRTLPPGAA